MTEDVKFNLTTNELLRLGQAIAEVCDRHKDPYHLGQVTTTIAEDGSDATFEVYLEHDEGDVLDELVARYVADLGSADVVGSEKQLPLRQMPL